MTITKLNCLGIDVPTRICNTGDCAFIAICSLVVVDGDYDYRKIANSSRC